MSNTERPELMKGHGEAAVAICEALGLKPNLTAGLEFSLLPNSIVRVIVTRYATDDEGRRIAKVLEGFNLVTDGSEREVTPIGDRVVNAKTSDAAVQKFISKQ